MAVQKIFLEKFTVFKKEKINGHVPTGLNENRFNAFTKISFALVSRVQIKSKYSIICNTME